MSLSERGLEQGALDLRDVIFHVDAFRKHGARGDGKGSLRSCRHGARLGTFGGKLGPQLAAEFQSYGALDGVFQLADVARPFVAAQGVERRLIYAMDTLAGGRSILLHEMVGEQGDVLPAFA